MLHVLLSFGDVFSVLLIAAGIAVLVWNISVQAGAFGKRPKRRIAVAAQPQPQPRESENQMRVRQRDPWDR